MKDGRSASSKLGPALMDVPEFHRGYLCSKLSVGAIFTRSMRNATLGHNDGKGPGLAPIAFEQCFFIKT